VLVSWRKNRALAGEGAAIEDPLHEAFGEAEHGKR